ncbi:unnamed protein product [Peronospora effusa]|nr:unnamed protein product [Peronospora effusa]
MAIDLGNHYDKNNVDFLEMLEKSTKDAATIGVAIELQDGWIRSMVKKTGVPTDKVIKDVLNLINLGDNNVLGSSRFEAYVKLMGRKHATNANDLYQAMAIDLGNHYDKNNVDFLEMLEKSTKDAATIGVAIELQDGWIRSMVKKRECLPIK